jgi:hypothetical protein
MALEAAAKTAAKATVEITSRGQPHAALTLEHL